MLIFIIIIIIIIIIIKHNYLIKKLYKIFYKLGKFFSIT